MGCGCPVSGTLDQYAIDEARWLEALQREWPAYDIKADRTRWIAHRHDGGGEALIAASASGLHQQLQAARHGAAS